jgi:hypothetical protein
VRWYYNGKIYVDLADAQAAPTFSRRLLVQTPRLSGDDVRAVQERLSLLAYWPGHRGCDQELPGQQRSGRRWCREAADLGTAVQPRRGTVRGRIGASLIRGV